MVDEHAWIAWCLIGALPCFALVICIEYVRERPLIDVRWLTAATFVRWATIAIICRFVQSEQSVGVMTMLRDFGLANDDIRPLSLAILGGAIAGLAVSAWLVTPARLIWLVLASLLLAACAAYLNSFSSTLTRVPQVIVSQAMMGMAGAMFIGPSFIFGLGRVLAERGVRMTSFIALFGITQSVGTLVGNAFTQTYLYHAQQYHLADLAAQTERSDTTVSALTTTLSSQYLSVLTDPALRAAEGVQALSQQVVLNARVAAYNDVFLAISAIAAFGALILLCFMAAGRIRVFLDQRFGRTTS